MVIVTVTAGATADAQIPTAAAYRARVMANPNLRTLAGEAFSWHARSGVDGFFQGWETTRDTAWLVELQAYLDWLVEKTEVEPDGYRGWVGPRMGGDGALLGPHVVGDANLIEPMIRFAEIVLADETRSVRFGDPARSYIALARHIIEKWDRRGAWEVDGEFAVYTQQDQWRRAEDPGRFVTVPRLKRTENMNKSGKMGWIFLRLHRLTGEPEWRARAVKIFSQYKRIFRYLAEEDRVIFNFWEPFGPWDLDPETGQPLGWVNVHPNRAGYQAMEVGMFVEAYHAGVVFTREDIERLVRTNLAMWNRDAERPVFRAADLRSDAGQLWSALADFDPTIRDLRRRAAEREGGLAQAYFERVVAVRPVGFDRRAMRPGDEPVLPEIPLQDSRDLNYAAAIPGAITPATGEATWLAAQVRGRGVLRIEIYSGNERVAQLLEKDVDGTVSFDGRAGFESLRWDGAVNGRRLPPGDYTVRWTLNESRSERALRIR